MGGIKLYKEQHPRSWVYSLGVGKFDSKEKIQMAPFVEFISQLAGILAEDSKFSPEEAEREAVRIEAENRQEIAQSVGRGYGTIIFYAGHNHYVATLKRDFIKHLNRSADA
jgi:hypothetical protein